MKNDDFSKYVKLMHLIKQKKYDKRSDLEIIFGIGLGTTATHGLASTLYALGLNVIHWEVVNWNKSVSDFHWNLYGKSGSLLGKKLKKKPDRRGYFDKKKPKKLTAKIFEDCQRYYNEMEFIIPQNSRRIDALADAPYPEFFWDFYQT